MLLFAFGVSIDSFSVGFGIKALTNNIFIASSIFAISSFIFTEGGLLMGSIAKKLIGIYANIFGSIILLIIGIIHFI